MMEIIKEKVEAVVITDTCHNNFSAIKKSKPMGLFSVAEVLLVDCVLEVLALLGVIETIMFYCQDSSEIKKYLQQTCYKDKGTAMSLLYKEVASGHPFKSSDKTILAADAHTKKEHIHKIGNTLDLPLGCVLNHPEVKIHHNLPDANIAHCPSMLPLFSDNFDFQPRDVKGNQYADVITDWKNYRLICRDSLQQLAYLLSKGTGSFSLQKTTSKLSRSPRLLVLLVLLGLFGDSRQINVYAANNVIAPSATIYESNIMDNNVIHDYCRISNSFIASNNVINDNVILDRTHMESNNVINHNSQVINTNILNNCVIGRNVRMVGCTVGNNVKVKDNAEVINRFIDDNAVVG